MVNAVISIVESGSAPVAQLDRASDFESYYSRFPFLAKNQINIEMGYLAGFRAILPK
jgi:hypothetical protein